MPKVSQGSFLSMPTYAFLQIALRNFWRVPSTTSWHENLGTLSYMQLQPLCWLSLFILHFLLFFYTSDRLAQQDTLLDLVGSQQLQNHCLHTGCFLWIILCTLQNDLQEKKIDQSFRFSCMWPFSKKAWPKVNWKKKYWAQGRQFRVSMEPTTCLSVMLMLQKQM